MKTINIQQKLSQIQDHWNPRIAAELNGQYIKLVKLKGEFVWHQHDFEDEMFLVLSGSLKMEFKDKTETINPNEFIVVPKGTQHRPVADEEVSVMLFEPKTTLNTGNLNNEMTRSNLDYI